MTCWLFTSKLVWGMPYSLPVGQSRTASLTFCVGVTLPVHIRQWSWVSSPSLVGLWYCKNFAAYITSGGWPCVLPQSISMKHLWLGSWTLLDLKNKVVYFLCDNEGTLPRSGKFGVPLWIVHPYTFSSSQILVIALFHPITLHFVLWTDVLFLIVLVAQWQNRI